MQVITNQDLEQITKELIQTIHHFKDSLSYYTDSDFEKTFEDGWSMAQLYDHLYSSSKLWFGYKITNCLNKEKGTTEGELTPEGKFILDRGYISHTKKVPMPAGLAEPISHPKSHFETEMATYSAHVQDLATQIQLQPDNQFRTKHPIFGMLTAGEWLKADLIHWKHHLRQQKEIEQKLIKG